MKLEEMVIDVEQQTEVNGAIEEVFKGVLYRFGAGNEAPNGESLQLNLEPWAGGRWFRDRGNGVTHLWGHVQAIKPPVLLELTGPLFMSYPALNHVEVRLEESAGGTRLRLRHRALGLLDGTHRENVKSGWKKMVDNISSDFAGAPAPKI
jgi:hypothetical protein